MAEALRRRIAVVTVGRSDFSILRPLVQRLCHDARFDAGLWVGGAHFDPASGRTVDDIVASGLPIWARIDAQSYGHTPAGTVAAMSHQLAGFGHAITAGPRPDLVIILGDRFEAIAAGLACVPHNLPVAHLSGGSVSEGAMDDVFRHALTKIACLHFCDIPDFARRIRQMGEQPARIFTVGALGLDGIAAAEPRAFDEFVTQFAFTGLQPGYVLATLHSETRYPERTGPMAHAMVAALAASGRQVIYTYPNADPGSAEIIAAITAAARTHAGHHVVRNFGSTWFYTALAHAGMVVGNSSSGLYEAGSFRLPVLDIGERQKGRFHGRNVLHCAATEADIAKGLQATAALSGELKDFVNPYGDGRAADRIVDVLAGLDWGDMASPKVFADI